MSDIEIAQKAKRVIWQTVHFDVQNDVRVFFGIVHRSKHSEALWIGYKDVWADEHPS